MTGCCVAVKCAVAWRFGESSQHPTWPHVLHSRSATQTVPSARHSSHPPGVRGGGKSEGFNPSRCSHEVAISVPPLAVGRERQGYRVRRCEPSASVDFSENGIEARVVPM